MYGKVVINLTRDKIDGGIMDAMTERDRALRYAGFVPRKVVLSPEQHARFLDEVSAKLSVVSARLEVEPDMHGESLRWSGMEVERRG